MHRCCQYDCDSDRTAINTRHCFRFQLRFHWRHSPPQQRSSRQWPPRFALRPSTECPCYRDEVANWLDRRWARACNQACLASSSSWHSHGTPWSASQPPATTTTTSSVICYYSTKTEDNQVDLRYTTRTTQHSATFSQPNPYTDCRLNIANPNKK